MIRLPRYGKNIRRYADAAFDAAWRETMALTVEELRGYHDEGNPDCAVPFDLSLKFGKSGLFGATVTRMPPVPDGGFRVTGSLIHPFAPIDWQRQRWHAEIYRAVAMRYAIERYHPATGRRPLYLLPDAQVEVMAQLPTTFDGDLVQGVEQRCRHMIAQWELDHRANESNHAKLERLSTSRNSA
ncbi:hypothetical protein [Paracoccus beibuensis]|uniref:hypothetical protein n=1 Tax=Paracoccus beibuensis TaxID=547602 RepID=UPI00223F2908|nr:hypothetical protein [Paracoccus beibuensis]